MNETLSIEVKVKFIQIYINEIKNRDFIENKFMNIMISNMYDFPKLENLLQYLILQLAPAHQFPGTASLPPTQVINNSHQVDQTQINGQGNHQGMMQSQENYKYPAYIFQNYKNIKHIKVAFFINEDIYKQTNQNCLQFFQENKRKLTS